MTDSRTALGLVLVSALIMVGVFQLALRPKLTDAKHADQRAAQQLRADQLGQQVQVLQAAVAQAPHNRKQLSRLARALPDTPEPARLLRQLDGAAHGVSVRLDDTALQNTAQTPGGAPGTQATALGPAVLPLGLKLTGRYADLGRLAGTLATWVHEQRGQVRVGGRLVTLDGFTLTASASGDQISADARLMAFVNAGAPR